MQSKWAHLPSASAIDRVLASYDMAREKWDAVVVDDDNHAYWNAVDAALCIIRDPAKDFSQGLANCTARKLAVEAVSYYAHLAAYCTAVALIAYDASASLLDYSLEEIELLVDRGHPYAILFLPAVIAMG